MPKVRRKRTRRRTRTRTRERVLLYVAPIIAILSCTTYFFMHHLQSQTADADLGYSVVGQPSVNEQFIDQVLTYYHSPASGKGHALYTYGIQYGIDPAYALAFFMHESTFGTRGMATVTHSLGNIRATPGHQQYKGYRAYSSWEAGFEDWYQLISTLYVSQWGLSTVEQIIPIYAPPSDNNNDRAYIQAIKSAVDTWHKGSIAV